MRIKLSQSDWQRIGEEMGWMKISGYGYRSDSIMGYIWDADEHSVGKTRQAIKAGILKVTDPEARLDENGIPESGVEDREGNEIHPIFAGDQEEAGEIDDQDDQGDYRDHSVSVTYELITTEGNLARKGSLEASSEGEMFNILEGMMKGKACGPDGPIYGVDETPKKDSHEYTFEVFGEDGVSCGFIIAKKSNGKPFNW
jgi:hypothetical protein